MTATSKPITKRPAVWVAAAIAVVIALLVGVLATRKPATDRLVKSPLLGKQAPALTGRVLDNGSGNFDIGNQQGKWVLVNFFATWCVPCQQEHDDLIQFANAHTATNDATVVSVVFSDEADNVQKYFAQRGGDWPVVRDDDGAIATGWGVARVPESYLVAPNGLVVLKITGGVSYGFLQQELTKLQSTR